MLPLLCSEVDGSVCVCVCVCVCVGGGGGGGGGGGIDAVGWGC